MSGSEEPNFTSQNAGKVLDLYPAAAGIRCCDARMLKLYMSPIGVRAKRQDRVDLAREK